MMIKILPSSKVRDHMASIIKEIKQDGSFCFVTQYGKAEAVLMDINCYNELISRLEDIGDEQDAQLVKQIKQAKKHFQMTGGIRLKDV